MKNASKFILPIFILVVFVLFLLSGEVLKLPFGQSDDVMNYVDQIEEDVAASLWEEAELKVTLLERAWQKVERRVQYTTEKVNLIGMRTSIARIRGAISAADITETYVAVELLRSYWKHLQQ